MVASYQQTICSIVRRDNALTPCVLEIWVSVAGCAVPQASHDDPAPETRRWYQDVGCEICEFPKTHDTAILAREFRNNVIFGAPNVVRGGSHQKNSVAAAAMIADGLCTVLTSDYYYPSMLPAAFRLLKDGVCGFSEAWALIASHPAAAAGLTDRGSLAPGLRADMLLVDAPEGQFPRAAATFVAGRLVYGAKGMPSSLV